MSARGDNPDHHAIVVERDRHGHVDAARFICGAPADADCRVYPGCDCEAWYVGHEEEHGPAHGPEQQDTCWIEPWMTWGTADDVAEQHHDPVADVEINTPDDLRDGPIAVDWNGDHITWRYADEKENP